MRMSGWVSGILDRMSVYFGQPGSSMAGIRTTAMSPVVFGPEIRNFTHCASSTTAIRRSLGSGNLLEPELPEQIQVLFGQNYDEKILKISERGIKLPFWNIMFILSTVFWFISRNKSVYTLEDVIIFFNKTT